MVLGVLVLLVWRCNVSVPEPEMGDVSIELNLRRR